MRSAHGPTAGKIQYCRVAMLLSLLTLISQARAQDGSFQPESYSAAIWDYLTVGNSLTVGIGGEGGRFNRETPIR